MIPPDDLNPFATIRATDYTDEQINSLWVELDRGLVDSILEPRLVVSKYILGSKGSGKTHLLRYNSYQVARLRAPRTSGAELIREGGCLAIFLRTSNMDSGRFNLQSGPELAMQQLFGAHLELRLVDILCEALTDVQNTSKSESFDDKALIAHLSRTVADESLAHVDTLSGLRKWVTRWLQSIDEATNAAAFTGQLSLRLPFPLGALALPIGAALRSWHPVFRTANIIYILDEIENLSEQQQEVVNTLIRYAEGRVTFRLTGRLYARKTLGTIAGGEENREGSEFKTTKLDEQLAQLKNYQTFALQFVAKRMGAMAVRGARFGRTAFIDPASLFDELSVQDLVERHAVPAKDSRFGRGFVQAASRGRPPILDADELLACLVDDFPPLLQRLNVLLFCKKLGPKKRPKDVAAAIRADCENYLADTTHSKSTYSNALGHWKGDLLAQLCRESRRRDAQIPYAGFGTFVAMSSHNPRNLLVLLGKVYEIAAFKQIEFSVGSKLSVDVQTSAAVEAARFCFEADSNYGVRSDKARECTSRLAELLRTARYALNIPEVSPLAITFDNSDLSLDARSTLEAALNYSLLIEISEGRPDRNTQRLKRKVQLSPMLSPRWGLPIGRRGDLSVNGALLNAIFDPTSGQPFDIHLRQQSARWNSPFAPHPVNFEQEPLF